MVVTIKNDSIEARINPLGAELESLYRVSTGMEYLCPKEKPIWKEQAPILFPFVGKLKNEYYLFEGKKYSAQTHGFGRKKLFDLMEKTDSAAAFRLTSNEDTRQDYPFDFSLSVVYRLDGDQLYVSTTMENTGDGPLYYAVGFHPGFLCPLQPSLRAEDYYLVFDPPLTASIAVMDGYMIDHTEKRYNNCPRIKISRELFSQGAVTLTDLSSHRVRLCTDDSPHYVEVAFDDYTELALWTPTEKEMEIKYICIEPRCGLQDFSSGDNELINKPGMIAVSAKGYDRRQFSITVK